MAIGYVIGQCNNKGSYKLLQLTFNFKRLCICPP